MSITSVGGLSGALSVGPTVVPASPLVVPAGATQDFIVGCTDNGFSVPPVQSLSVVHDGVTAGYTIQCNKYVPAIVTQAVKAILASQILPRPDRVFGNGFE
jgi:hypothetical protein